MTQLTLNFRCYFLVTFAPIFLCILPLHSKNNSITERIMKCLIWTCVSPKKISSSWSKRRYWWDRDLCFYSRKVSNFHRRKITYSDSDIEMCLRLFQWNVLLAWIKKETIWFIPWRFITDGMHMHAKQMRIMYYERKEVQITWGEEFFLKLLKGIKCLIEQWMYHVLKSFTFHSFSHSVIPPFHASITLLPFNPVKNTSRPNFFLSPSSFNFH